MGLSLLLNRPMFRVGRHNTRSRVNVRVEGWGCAGPASDQQGVEIAVAHKKTGQSQEIAPFHDVW